MELTVTIEELKQLDLVELLSEAWGMSFKPEGGSFVAHSPFSEDRNPSFYVARASDGHWVYCDHSDGSSGSVIDLMMRKLQSSDFGRACAEARRLAQQCGVGVSSAAPTAAPETDWQWLYERLRANDASACRAYLGGRDLDEQLVDGLIGAGVIVLNRVDGSQYCCFAVHDASGRLQSLFSRRIDGPSDRKKFLLGRQAPFCVDWAPVAEAGSIYLCESIIDALSLLTVYPEACVIAVPGAHYDLSQLQLPDGVRLIDAFDADDAGRTAARRLQEAFADHQVERFDMFGAHDLNEFLQRRDWMSESVRGTAKLTAADRVAIALSDRPSREIARQYGIHHSRVCDIRNEASAILSGAWAERRPGRKPQPQPPEELLERQRELKEMKRQFELLTMRKEWLDLQLEMHERRDAEVESGERRKKRKKKRRRR